MNVYARLAKSEEPDSIAEFGQEYEQYRKRTPAILPALGRRDVKPGHS